MSNKLLRIIKKAAKEAVEDSKPANIVFGTVGNTAPYEIKVNPQLLINESGIVKTAKLSSLSEGDKVVLLRAAGGQKYVVLDVIE